MEKINSPCVRNCCLDQGDICLGCFRSLDEILQWSKATEQEKQEILHLTDLRRNGHQLKGFTKS